MDNSTAGFSRVLVLWGLTLILIGVGIGATLFLIDRSKQLLIPTAPPPLPAAANLSDEPPPPQELNLFLLDAGTSQLVPVKTERRLRAEPTRRLAQVIEALIKEKPPNFRNMIPGGTVLRKAYIDSGQTAYLDFSTHLTEGHIGGTRAELLTITAILKTVFDAFPDDIKQVQILVEGTEIETLAGHLNLSQPLHLFQ